MYELFQLFAQWPQAMFSWIPQPIFSDAFHLGSPYYTENITRWRSIHQPSQWRVTRHLSICTAQFGYTLKKNERISLLPCCENNCLVSCVCVVLGAFLSMLSEFMIWKDLVWQPYETVSNWDWPEREAASSDAHLHHEVTYCSHPALANKSLSFVECTLAIFFTSSLIVRSWKQLRTR